MITKKSFHLFFVNEIRSSQFKFIKKLYFEFNGSLPYYTMKSSVMVPYIRNIKYNSNLTGLFVIFHYTYVRIFHNGLHEDKYLRGYSPYRR